MDPIKLAFIADAAALTKEQIDEFKAVSELLIKVGRVERLDERATLQAIDNLAFQIAKLSFETAFAFRGLTHEEVCALPEVKPDVDKLDEIMLTIAFGSGIHKAIIDVLVSERNDFHTKVFCDKLTLLAK